MGFSEIILFAQNLDSEGLTRHLQLGNCIDEYQIGTRVSPVEALIVRKDILSAAFLIAHGASIELAVLAAAREGYYSFAEHLLKLRRCNEYFIEGVILAERGSIDDKKQILKPFIKHTEHSQLVTCFTALREALDNHVEETRLLQNKLKGSELVHFYNKLVFWGRDDLIELYHPTPLLF